MLLGCLFLLAAIQSYRFAVLTDVHYDLYYNENASLKTWCRGPDDPSVRPAPFGRIGCDSSANLIRATVADMAARIQREPIDMVVTLGDFPGHLLRSYEDNRESVAFIVDTIDDYLGDAMLKTSRAFQCLTTIGNNEEYPNYNASYLPYDDQFADLFSLFDLLGWLDDSTKEDFLRTGSYTWRDPGRKIVYLNINTVYYSKKFTNATRLQNKTDPFENFNWMRKVLQEARRSSESVIILAHAPFGVNGYTKKVNTGDLYTDTFTAIVGEFADVIVGVFSGHYHVDLPMYIPGPNGTGVPVFVNPSVSQSSKSNPGYRIYDLDVDSETNKLTVRDYQQYFLDVEAANDNGNTTFSQEYGFRQSFSRFLRDYVSLDGSVIRELYDAAWTDEHIWTTLSAHMYLEHSTDRRPYLCSTSSASLSDYSECLQQV